MTDLTHLDIVERLAALEVRLDERFATIQRDIASLQEALTEAITKSATQRERIVNRLESLERRAAIMDAADQAQTQTADRWRARFYVVLRYILPPSASAGVVVWLAEKGVL